MVFEGPMSAFSSQGANKLQTGLNHFIAGGFGVSGVEQRWLA